MANDENLNKGKNTQFNNRSGEEAARAKECGRKGGKASGASRNFRKAFDDLMAGKVMGEKQNQILDLMNVEEGSRTYWTLVMSRIILDATAGNTGAQRILMEFSGEKPEDKRRAAELKLRREIFEYQKNGSTNPAGNELMESLLAMEMKHDGVE